MNYVDISNIVAANAGENVVLVFAIEEPSDAVQITATPELAVVKDYHEYKSESQRHPAVDPTFSTVGNVEFYTCAGCDKLYIKNGEEYVEVSAEDIILPTIKYSNTEFTGASLNLGKDLSIRYHVTLSETENIHDYVVRFTMNEKTTVVSDYELDATTGKYVFSFRGIAPQCMGDSITAELVKGEEVIDTQEDYSVRKYVINALEFYSDYAELTQLLSDLLYYGAAAQEYTGYKADALVTDGLELTAASTATPGEADKNREINGTGTDVKFTAAGVRFDYINRIYVKITAASLDGIKITVNGESLEILETNTPNIYVAYSDAISALDFSDKFVFTLSVGGSEIQTLTYTVNDYAFSKHNDTEIGELALALYRYGKSAEAYEASK